MNLLMIIDGAIKGDFVTGGVVVLVSVVMVFIILLVIIGLTELVGKLLNKTVAQNAEPVKEEVKEAVNAYSPLDENDEDAMVAALVASIDYREQTHMNIKVLSVKEVK
ncbi:MAG: OadG family transporter subunit [Erysipelotrichaceae bacterium]